MDIWVLESYDPEQCSGNGSEFELYSDRTRALENACDKAISFMANCNCDDPSDPDFNLFEEVRLLIAKKAFFTALDKFNDEWVDNQNEDHQLYYRVYCRTLNEDAPRCSDTVSSSCPNTVKSASVQKQQDVPCKQCGRNVLATDTQCWYCTVNDPGKS